MLVVCTLEQQQLGTGSAASECLDGLKPRSHCSTLRRALRANLCSTDTEVTAMLGSENFKSPTRPSVHHYQQDTATIKSSHVTSEGSR